MPTKLACALAPLSLLLCLPAVRGSEVDRLPSWEARAYRVVVPAEGELRWQRIPWLSDLGEALAQAKKEKRPLLIWTSGDDPLQRC